jgi:pimeloyl-ACP methyl ester carboxylesterase
MTKLFSVSFVGELQQLAQGDRLPILIMHGDSDNGMPLTGSAEIVKKMLPWSELSVYEKAGHGESPFSNDAM